MHESTIATNSSTFQIVQDEKLESSKGVFHFVRCSDGGIRLMKVESKHHDRNYVNQSNEYQKNTIERSQSQTMRQRNNLPSISIPRSQSFSQINSDTISSEMIDNNQNLQNEIDTPDESRLEPEPKFEVESNFEVRSKFEFSLTYEVEKKLHKNAAKYVLKHENIVNSINKSTQYLKQLDDEEQKYKDFLEEEFRKAQEELNKQMKSKMKFLKEKMDEKKAKYEKEIKYLKEEQQDEISDFLSNQKNTIDQYKKDMKKLL